MRALLLFILLLSAAVASYAAAPSYYDFVGTNGIIVRSNPPIGKLIIDGAGIVLGGPAVAPGTNVTVQTNIVSGQNVYTVNSSGGGSTGAITNVSDAATDGISLIYTSNNFSILLATLRAGANVWLTNNGTNIVIAGQGTNGFVTATITNGLATISYVNGITNGLVTASVTNGLATISYVDNSVNFASNILSGQITTATNTLAADGRSELNSASNSLVTQITGATNTLAASGRSELNSASNSLVSQITTTSNGLSARLDGKIDELNGLGTNTIFYSTATNIPAVRVVGFSNDYENVALLVDTTNGSKYTVLAVALNGTNVGRLTVDPTLSLNVFNERSGGSLRLGATYQDTIDNDIFFSFDANTVLPKWSMIGTDFYPGDSSTYTIGLGTALLELYLPGGGAQAQINTKHPKFSVWSNNVEVVGLGVTTNFDFYGFTKLTNASGKVSIGAPTDTVGTSGITVQSNAFGGTVGGGTNLTFLTSSNLLLTATNTSAGGGTNSVSHDTAQGITTTASPTFANIGITTDASVSNHLAIGVNNTATNYPAAYKTRFFALTNPASGYGDWMAGTPMTARRNWFGVWALGIAVGAIGAQSAASVGSLVNAEANTNEWPAFSYSTGAANLSSNGIVSVAAATSLSIWPGKNYYFSFVGRISQMSTQRMWIGYTSATSATMGANSDTPTTSQIAMIRLSSAAAGALTNWALVTCDGGACTATAAGPVTLTTTNVHVFEIMEDRANNRVLGYVDGVAIGTNTANLPISGMKYCVMLSTLEAVAKTFRGSVIYGENDNRIDGSIVYRP